jgi:hypothetical protein
VYSSHNPKIQIKEGKSQGAWQASQGKGYHRRGLIVQIEIKLAILQADL